MSHVHYKFSSKLSYNTVSFCGHSIALPELRRQIMEREKIRSDLQVINEQTGQEYTDDDSLIPRGSSVIVRRIPISGVRPSSSAKTSSLGRSNQPQGSSISRAVHNTTTTMEDQTSTPASFFSKLQMANLVDADMSEEDKIQAMISQSTYDSISLNKELSVNYTCKRCGNTGHHVRNCPMGGEAPLRMKKCTGIPRSFLVEVDDPSVKGAMLTNCGRFAVPAIDAKAYAVGKKEKPPFVLQEEPKPEAEEEQTPKELLCPICHELLVDAAIIPCCGHTYCDDCIRTALLDSDEHTCPTCGQSDVSPDTLIANKFLRQTISNFKKERDAIDDLGGTSGPEPVQNQQNPQQSC